jgi:transcriptional regulator with GAF, ATPase, and Fis domain
MLQDKGEQRNFLHRLLALASRPATRLDGLLQFVLEKALALTSSDTGGAIFVLDISTPEQALVASALRGEFADTSTNLLKIWKENARSPAFVVLHSGKPYCIDDHQQDPAHFSLLAGGRSSLWVPLLEGTKVMGVFHVESSQPGYYEEGHISQLQNLAAETVPAINRLLLKEKMAQVGALVEVVGVSAPFLELERQIRLAAINSRSPVLITGERGSGKELTAWAIHCWSDRRNQAFVPVLASAFAPSLYADELFGHERHAFTGADSERRGKFKAAEGGTIFLDEVGELHPEVQSALLRTIERGELPRIGRDLPLRVDVRVIAATNRNLPELITQGRFRDDLYDRLRVFEIQVPPLRERREDIPLLANHFLNKYCQQMRRAIMDHGICAACQHAEVVGCATSEFYQALENYYWPGNVRELENLIIRLLAYVPDEVLDAKHLPEHFQLGLAKTAMPEARDLTFNAAMRSHIERVLQMTNYNQSQAAKVLDLPFSTLQSKMKKLGIEIKKE